MGSDFFTCLISPDQLAGKVYQVNAYQAMGKASNVVRTPGVYVNPLLSALCITL